MRLKSALKDWRRRRLLQRAGVGVEVTVPTFAAGARSGIWVVDPRRLGPQAVVYSVGVGDNIAWDLAMIERFGCTVHGFDPTPRAAAFVDRQRLPPQFVFHRLGLAAHDGSQAFAAPRKAGDVNYRPGVGELRAPVRRLATLARDLGHRRVDVLKLDIEGGEYEVLPDVLASGLCVQQLLIEFHHGQHGIAFAATARALAQLRDAGFSIFHLSRRGLEFSLLHTAAQTSISSGAPPA